MSYRDEFPDFDPSTMPAMPAGFVDTSWHNDICPSFSQSPDGGAGFVIWVDYADASQREFQETPRFTLARHEGDCGDDLDIVSSDNFADILRALGA